MLFVLGVFFYFEQEFNMSTLKVVKEINFGHELEDLCWSQVEENIGKLVDKQKDALLIFFS